MTILPQLNAAVHYRMADMSDAEVIELYRAARINVVSRADNTTDAALVMVAIGNELERRIGERAFYRLMGEIDRSAFIHPTRAKERYNV